MIFSLSPCQDDEYYEQTADVRSQLRFFEQLERIEKQRKDEQEREILLKAAKVSSLDLGIFLCVHELLCPHATVCFCVPALPDKDSVISVNETTSVCPCGLVVPSAPVSLLSI